MTNYKFNSDHKAYDLSGLPITLADGLRKYANIIVAIENETHTLLYDGTVVNDGYWIHFHEGFIDPEFKIHMIHEYTIADCLARLPHIVRCTEHNCNNAADIAVTNKWTHADQIAAKDKARLEAIYPQLKESEYTVEQPNEFNSSLSDAIEYWSKRAYHYTMLWGRERIQNPWSQISSKFAALSDLYYSHKLSAENEVKRLMALRPYKSPLMEYVAMFILISAAIAEPTPLKIKHSKRSPITTVSPRAGVQRVVVYKVVKVISITDMESNWGIRYGTIRINGEKRLVISRLQSNNTYSQWETL